MNVNTKSAVRLSGLLVTLLLFFSTAATAQLGEVAGHLNFVVPVGYNQTLQWYLLNEGNTSIAVRLSLPAHLQLTSNAALSANQPLPTLSISPQNATVPPHSQITINVTVGIPKNETPGIASWEGILSAQEVTNLTNPGGAVVIEGVAKIFAIASILPPPPPTTSTIAQTQAPITTISSPTNPILGAALLIIAVFAAYGYYRYLKGRGTAKQKPKGKKREKPGSDEAESLRREIARLKREQERLKRQVKTSKNPRRSASRKRKGPTRRSTRRTRRRRR